MPGSRDNSVARSSIADINCAVTCRIASEGASEGASDAQRRGEQPWSRSKRQFEWEIQPAGEFAHLLLRGGLGLLLRVGHGDDQQVLEHLDVGRIHDARIELDLLDLARAG